MCRKGIRHCRGARAPEQRTLENAQRRVTRNTTKAATARNKGDEAKATTYDRLVASAAAEVADLSRPTAEVYDASGDPITLTLGVIDDEADWVYTNGQCLALAVAMSEQTGWPVVLRAFTDGDGYEDDEPVRYTNLRHAYVQQPDGSLLDIRGEHDPIIVDEECRDFDGDAYLPPRIVDSHDSRVLLAEFEGYLSEQDLDTARHFVAPVLQLAHPTQELSSVEFADLFPPGLYSDNWQSVADGDGNGSGFDGCGDMGWEMDELCESIATEGMHEPVTIVDGEVTEGHHRVVAAIAVGAPVRYRVF